jgi:predicted RNA binding protein YcfA (HicA-like mRNA interferase family)
MAGTRRVFEAVLSGRGVINFRDFERLLHTLGFELKRISGSHRIYLHPKVGRPFSVQPVGKDAKPYQVRQLRDIIREFDLRLED